MKRLGPIAAVVIPGAVAGLIAAGVYSGWRDRGRAPVADHPPLLADCTGAIQTVVIQTTPDTLATVLTIYQAFCAALPTDVETIIVGPSRESCEQLIAKLGPVNCRLTPLPVGHRMTTWSRDRWLATAPDDDGRAHIIRPWSEESAERWPDRAGDERLADDLAEFRPDRYAAFRHTLKFDGGDFVADSETVFVTPRVAERNGRFSAEERERLRLELVALTRRDVVLLDRAPDHHAGMYLMPIGERRIFVGDARRLAVGSSRPIAEDFDDPQTRDLLDAVAEQCKAAGYEVRRMPVIPVEGRAWMTPLNVILDERGDQPTVYMPTFAEAPVLNRSATRIWQSVGYDVVPIDCSTSYPHGGSLRCLVNILARSGPAADVSEAE